MPEPKKAKRTFEVQAHAPLPGLQVLPQPAGKESSHADQPEGARRERATGPAESSLVEKLIDFFKAMD